MQTGWSPPLEAAGTIVNINYTRRFLPEWVEARRMIADGELGRLSQIVVQMGGPRAMLFRNHTHAIDLIMYLAGAAPEWVIAELEPGFEAMASAMPVTVATTRLRSPARTTTSASRTACVRMSPG